MKSHFPKSDAAYAKLERVCELAAGRHRGRGTDRAVQRRALESCKVPRIDARQSLIVRRTSATVEPQVTERNMGRIITRVTIGNAADPAQTIRCMALVDTGSAGLVLPAAWKVRLGDLPLSSLIQMETADQRVVTGEVCGPVTIQIEGFRPVSSEVTFLDMLARNRDYEPLLGYTVLQQSQAAVDMARDCLVPVKYVDLKALRGTLCESNF